MAQLPLGNSETKNDLKMTVLWSDYSNIWSSHGVDTVSVMADKNSSHDWEIC